MSPKQGNILVASDKPFVSKHGLGTLDNFATSQPLMNTHATIGHRTPLRTISLLFYRSPCKVAWGPEGLSFLCLQKLPSKLDAAHIINQVSLFNLQVPKDIHNIFWITEKSQRKVFIFSFFCCFLYRRKWSLASSTLTTLLCDTHKPLRYMACHRACPAQLFWTTRETGGEIPKARMGIRRLKIFWDPQNSGIFLI